MTNFDLFFITLPFLLKGLLGIFIVTLIIVLAITVLNKITAPKEKADRESETLS